jgi:adenine phosphoribosyltransferase
VPARKPGKLPAASDKVAYTTEYSNAELEMHKASIREGANVVIVDDVLATGGTAKAASELVQIQGGYVSAYAFVIELSFLNGRERLLPVRVESVLSY